MDETTAASSPMSPLTTGLLIGLGGGLLKNFLVDKPRENRDRELRAAEIQYSPWSKMKEFSKVRDADPIGTTMEFGTTGAMMGAGIQNQQKQNELSDAMTKFYDQGGPWSIRNRYYPGSLGIDYNSGLNSGYDWRSHLYG